MAAATPPEPSYGGRGGRGLHAAPRCAPSRSPRGRPEARHRSCPRHGARCRTRPRIPEIPLPAGCSRPWRALPISLFGPVLNCAAGQCACQPALLLCAPREEGKLEEGRRHVVADDAGGAGAGEELVDGALALVAQVDGEAVDVEVDVLALHRL